MKNEFFLIAIFLIISNLAVAQQPALGSSGGAGGDWQRMRLPMPDVPRAIPPFLKGDQTLAETWSSTIAAFGNNPDGMTVNCFAEDSDNLYIGGDFFAFDTVKADFVVHYNRKTGVWNALDGGLGNTVLSLALHNDTLYAGGNFQGAGSADSAVGYIAMWDGVAWHSMDGGMNAEVTSLAFIGDTLYAGGYFTEAGGDTASRLAFWDGQHWHEAFGGASSDVLTLLATHDTLFVGGNFNYVGSGNTAKGLDVRGSAMLRDGQWTPLGTGYHANCFALFDGNLWAGGEYYLGDGTLVNEMASWNGAVWTAYSADTLVGTNATGEVDQLLVTGDTLLVLGNFSSIAGVNANGIAMYHGGVWSQFAGGLYGYGLAAISFNGKLYIGGRFTQAGNVNAMAIATLSNGTWLPLAHLSYQNVGWASDEVTAIATTDRYVFIGGNFETIAGQTCNHVAAYDKQASTWITLGSGVDGDVRSLAVQGNNLIVGGTFNHAGAVSTRHIAEYNMVSKLWSPMGNGAHRYVSGIAVNGDSVYAPIGYAYSSSNGYDYLGQWNGTNWNTYGNGLQVGYIEALAWQGSTLYAAGSFLKADDGTVLDYIAQIQAGGSWSSLNSGLNNTAFALAVSGDSLYVGGAFTEADGQVDSSLAVWNNTTQEWNPIGASGFNGTVYALAADGNGGVYAGGEFSEVAQVGRGNLVHWDGSSFGTVASGVNNTVEALATDPSALYAGGWFTEAGSTTNISLHFGALDGAGAVSAVNSSAVIAASLSIYPNPAAASSNITLTFAKAANIRLELFNALGNRIALVADGTYQSGAQIFPLDATKLTSGIYFLCLTNDGVASTKNFVVQ
jgi:hypothetical protein